MSGYLVDTNVLSEYSRPNPEQAVMRWFGQAEPDQLYASVVTFGELMVGVEALAQGRRRTELAQWLETGLPDWFDSNMLPVTRTIAGRWGKLSVQARRQGLALHTPDGLIAATALEHDLTLVTRNVSDFASLGITIFNPWEQA